MQHAKSSAAAAGAVCRQCRLSRTTSASQPTRAFTTAKFRKERGHWESIENQRSLLVGVADKLALPNATTDISAWKAVTNQQFRAMGGGAALNKHGGSLYRLLTSAFPEMAEASSASRTKLPNGYWKLIDNRRQFFNELAASHSIEKDEDWKRVLLVDVVKAGGSALLKPYRNSVFAALVDTFPEKEWDEFTVRPHVSRGYWDEEANRRAFLERFVRDWKAKRGERAEPTLPLGSKEVWREVDVADICSCRGGATFMKHYHFSLARALKELLPAQDWSIEEVQSRMPKNYWREKENVRRFLDRMAEDLGIAEPSGWRSVRNADIVANGGFGLLQHHGSLLKALQLAYPEQSFSVESCRPSVPRTHWEDDRAVKDFITGVAEKLRIREQSDWARVSLQQLRSLGAGSLLNSMSLSQALEITYPNDGPWEFASERSRQRPGKCAQRSLAVALAELLGSKSSLERGITLLSSEAAPR